jgi:hypothetical protein
VKTRSLCSATNNWKKVKKLATTAALVPGLLVSYKKNPLKTLLTDLTDCTSIRNSWTSRRKDNNSH